MGRIMIAGTSSGCGKTTIVCAILQALVNRHVKTVSFKCGPDYIDPMFHSKIIGTKSRNLDGFFMDPPVLNYLLHKNSEGAQMSVIEGVMGYFDGLGMEDTGSSYEIAKNTDTPVVLILQCKGMSKSVQALLTGFLAFEEESHIRGVIFNQLPASLYPEMKKFCEHCGVKALGCFPNVQEAQIGSRHLGLITADEITNLKEKMNLLAETAERYLDMDGLMELSKSAGKKAVSKQIHIPDHKKTEPKLQIGVASDLAFCFYYEDNLDFLRDLGCEIIPFSPLHDPRLPDDLDGLILGGGYPELYLEELSANRNMLHDIKEQIEQGLVTHGECGGFMYLHKSIKSPEGGCFPMVGVVNGECYYTDRLQRFGYVTLTALKDNILCHAREKIRAHEFHRYESTAAQDVFLGQKRNQTWTCNTAYKNLVAGFPHIHYYANLSFAVRFYNSCVSYRKSKHILT